MYGEAGTEYIYDSFATKVRLRDQQDLYFNEDIYQTIFPPRQPRLSLADISFGGVKKVCMYIVCARRMNSKLDFSNFYLCINDKKTK